ncbi:response regulator [Paenibacillus sp. DCT19]|uniref:response regulator n=1 Tax=Paenibacillus sp. DCT19 TaxID=2211212 RepID=UPI000FE20F77|nr:response regulator [Paenibacillus sp. DCT19]
MYNVMIVEDSKPILRNIRSHLDTLNLPLRVTATATNGEEALAIIRQEPIHLLLTDIRMPKMDGLTLIEQAKLTNPYLKVVLISGYSDFEYTRKALNLQVFDYLLKPVEREALEEVMGRIVEQLDRLISRSLQELQEIVDPECYAELTFGEEFPLYSHMMIILRKQPFSQGKDRWSLETLKQSLAEFFHAQPCRVLLTQTPHQYIIMANRGALDWYSSMHECLESLRRHLLEAGMDGMIGGQLMSADSDQLSELYYRITSVLTTQQRLKHGLVLDTGNPVSIARSETNGLDSSLESTFVHMIQGCRKEAFALKLTELMNRWTEENAHWTEVERFVGLVVDTFAHLYEERGSGMRLALELRAKQLYELKTYADFGHELLEWTAQCFDMLQSQGRKSGELLFEQIDEYVKTNRYVSLSISDLSMKFHVSPSYISRVIKHVTQRTFVQYYTELRIQEACRLMASQPDMKFKELSELLSFSDQHYFSKVFKEYTGVSPTDYKERLLTTQPE